MKLLLTSSGITTDEISEYSRDLLGKDFANTSIAYVPTAMNVEEGDKSWAISSTANLLKLGFKYVDIVDISALEKSIWLARLQKVDVVYFEGGNTFHLMRSMSSSGFTNEVAQLFKDKVWVGVSAGSMVAASDLCLDMSQKLYGEDLLEKENIKGLGLVDFYVVPHLNSKWFTEVTEENVKNLIKGYTKKVYLLDDSSAVKVDGAVVEVVGPSKLLN